MKLEIPEGATAVCRFCGEPLVLDQMEGGGPAMDWGAGEPSEWPGNGGIGLDYGCGNNPESDEEGTAGHSPIWESITYAGVHVWHMFTMPTAV